MDQDFGLILGTNINSSRVAYSYGYSWENDVVQFDALESFLISLVGTGIEQVSALNEMKSEFDNLSQKLVRWLEIDIALKAKGCGCLFKRAKPLFCTDMQNLPKLREQALKDRLLEIGYTRGPNAVVRVLSSDVRRMAFGKYISMSTYHYFMKVVKQFAPNFTLNYDAFMRFCTIETFRLAAAGGLPGFVSHVSRYGPAFA
jgi:hypothetical protein